MSTSGGSSGGGGPSYQSGAGVPTTKTPAAAGQLYIDTTNGGVYAANSTTEGDWSQLGGGPSDNDFPGVNARNLAGAWAMLYADGNDYIDLQPGALNIYAGGTQLVYSDGTAMFLSAPLNTATVAAISTPSVSSGNKFQCSTVGDGLLTFYITHAGTLTVTMGPSTGAENTLLSAVSVLADSQFDFWVPATWQTIITLASSATAGSYRFTLV